MERYDKSVKPSADSICQPLRYIDLFAGAGGVSEGFVAQSVLCTLQLLGHV